MATRPLEHRRSSFRLRGVPVLIYHGLGASDEAPSRGGKYCVPSPRFRDQLKQIRDEGYSTCLLREIWTEARNAGNDSSSVVLTFDDGTGSDYEVAFPLLQEAGFRAEFFVNPGTIGHEGFLTWPQIAEMQRAGMSFQSHGYDHVDLSRLGTRQLQRQVRHSKRVLEDGLGCSVDFIAVPHGLFTDRVLDMALREGHRAVCTSQCRPALPGSKVVSRVAIYRHTTNDAYRRLLAGNVIVYGMRTLRSAALYIPKNILLHFSPATLGVNVLDEPT